MPAVSLHAEDNSTRMERNLIVEGNKLYHDKKYADAEVAYRKALEIDAMNEIAQFNLAASLLRQGTSTGENEKQASQILGKLASDAENMSVAEKAFYNLGNIAFNGQDYAKSIELYKNALRRNPDNDQARE
ncbi:tetratricopeptide repeat protein, partial [uncultured Duncaniella sp.]